MELFEALLSNLPAAVIFVDSADQIRTWSRSAESLFGIGPQDFANHANVRTITGFDLAAGKNASESSDPASTTSNSGNGFDEPNRRSRRDSITNSAGQSISVDVLSIDLVVGGQPWRMIAIHQALPYQEVSAELERQAFTDALSELLNRRGFQRELESHLDSPLTLAILDVDFFKRVNDQYGHAAGDEVIRWISKKLQALFPQAICIARLGGDEFGVVMHSTDIEQTETMFESFRDSVETDHSASPLGMTVSIGVAIAHDAEVQPRELLSRADKAMYCSKRAGRNRVTLVEVASTR